jgi:hypothetical protein
MESKRFGLKVFSKKLLVFLFALVLSMPLAVQTCHAQQAAIEDKATSFLTDVIQLDLSHYKFTLNPQYTRTNDGHLFYNLDTTGNIFGSSQGNVVFSFYNGTLGSCNISPGLAGMVYLAPFSGRFNATLGILKRYETWANDSQIIRMVELLKKVGSEKIGLQVDGNLSLRISLYQSGLGIYQFSNYLNGVEYTYVSIGMDNQTTGDVFFTDSRVFQKIGNTQINVSTEQAIAIAQDSVKHYSYNHTFGNGSSIIVKDLNVSGVYAVDIASALKENMTLYPLYDVRLNVTGLPSHGLSSIGVKIWANDGTIQMVYHYIYPGSANFTDLMTDVFFFPLYWSAILQLFIYIGILIAVVAVVLIVLKKNNKLQS